MPGRGPKPKDRVKWEETHLKPRLIDLRDALFPLEKVGDRQRALCEKVGFEEAAYQKMEQRGALSAYQLWLICLRTGTDPRVLLGFATGDRRVRHIPPPKRKDRRRPPTVKDIGSARTTPRKPRPPE